MVKLTKKDILDAASPVSGQVLLRDDSLTGFAVRITPTRRTYVVDRKVRGRQYRITIGSVNDVTLQKAREKAQELISRLVLGEAVDDKTTITLSEAVVEYVKRRSLKPNSVKGYEQLTRLAVPGWKDKALSSITREMVLDKFQALTAASPRQANNYMRMLGAIYRLINSRRVYGRIENPVEVLRDLGVWNRELRRKSYIKKHQMAAWHTAVMELGGVAPNRNDGVARDYLRLVLFTGLRREEAAQLKVEWCDFDNRSVHIPGSVTKNGEPHDFPMTDQVFEILHRRRESPNGRIFTTRSNKGYIANVSYQMKTITKQSGVAFMIHDLRRTYATIAEGLDTPYYAIKRLLNHKVADVTSGYIVDDIDRLREPAQKIADEITRLCTAPHS